MSLGESLKKTLLNSSLPSVIETSGELAVDSLLDNGLLRDIPILGTIHAIGKTYSNIKDYYYEKDMIKFLHCMSSWGLQERTHLISKLESDSNYGVYAGEILTKLLSKLDDDKKIILIASSLKLYAQGEIRSVELRRLHNTIDKFLLCDIAEFRLFISSSHAYPTDANPFTANMVNSGLAYVSSGYGGGGVHSTETANLFLRILDEVGL